MPENDSARARMHAQIQALMTTALHPNTPPEEAMASREGALYLAAWYSVEEALAEARGAPRERPEVEDFLIDDEAGALPGVGMPALARLLIQIARSLHCVTFDWGNPSGGSRSAVGRPTWPPSGCCGGPCACRPSQRP